MVCAAADDYVGFMLFSSKVDMRVEINTRRDIDGDARAGGVFH